MSKAVLVLGAGVLQIPVFFSIKDLGYSVIACDENPDAVGKMYCDTFWNIDLCDTDAIQKKIQETQEILDIRAILTAGTDFSYAVSLLAVQNNVLGIPPEIARKFIFKDEMRRSLKKHAVMQPDFIVADLSKTEAYEIVKERLRKMGYPVIVKPLNNMGGRGVCTVSSELELGAALDLALCFSLGTRKQLIVEKKLQGPELSIDAMFNNGEFSVLAIADRHTYFSPYCIEVGHSIPSTLDKAMQEEACWIMEKAARALGLNHGICKADIIFENSVPYIGEIAARLSGGYMSGWTAPMYYKQNLSRLAVRLALDQPMHESKKTSSRINFLNKEKSCVTAERTLISVPGKIQGIQTIPYLQEKIFTSFQYSSKFFKELQKDDMGLSAIYVQKKVGEYSQLPRNNTEKTASLVLREINSELIDRTAANHLAEIFVDVEINKEASDFLFSVKEQNLYSPWRSYNVDEKREILKCTNEEKKQIAKYLHMQNPLSLMLLTISKEEWKEMDESQKGAWTFVNIATALKIAGEKNLVYTNSKCKIKEALFFEKLIWRAFLRGGWQGLYYLRKILCQNSNHITHYL